MLHCPAMSHSSSNQDDDDIRTVPMAGTLLYVNNRMQNSRVARTSSIHVVRAGTCRIRTSYSTPPRSSYTPTLVYAPIPLFLQPLRCFVNVRDILFICRPLLNARDVWCRIAGQPQPQCHADGRRRILPHPPNPRPHTRSSSTLQLAPPPPPSLLLLLMVATAAGPHICAGSRRIPPRRHSLHRSIRSALLLLQEHSRALRCLPIPPKQKTVKLEEPVAILPQARGYLQLRAYQCVLCCICLSHVTRLSRAISFEHRALTPRLRTTARPALAYTPCSANTTSHSPSRCSTSSASAAGTNATLTRRAPLTLSLCRRYFKADPEPLCDFFRNYGIGLLQVTLHHLSAFEVGFFTTRECQWSAHVVI